MRPHRLTTKSDNPFHIKAMTLNLRFGLADDGPNSWPFRKKTLEPLLSEYPCDVYAFQEANDFQISFLSTLLPDYDCIGMRKPAPDFWQNNVIFHHKKWQCLSHHHFFLSYTPHTPSRYRDSRWPRQCTMGVFQHKDIIFACVNTHLDFTSPVQVRSAGLIMERLAAVSKTHPARFTLLMGDFNSVPGSDCYKLFTSETNGFRRVVHEGFLGTHHGFCGMDRKEPIDWILYRGEFVSVEGCVVTKKYGGYFPSDHFPLHAVFSF